MVIVRVILLHVLAVPKVAKLTQPETDWLAAVRVTVLFPFESTGVEAEKGFVEVAVHPAFTSNPFSVFLYLIPHPQHPDVDGVMVYVKTFVPNDPPATVVVEPLVCAVPKAAG